MVYIVLMVLVALFVAVLALQNSMVVALHFLVWDFQLNLILVVLLSAACGFLVAALWGLKVKTQQFLRVRKLNDQIALLEDDKRILQEKVAKMARENAPAATAGEKAPAAGKEPKASEAPKAPAEK